MTDQPRESRTQRFAARTNSAPIESLSTAPADQKLARQLQQIDELFDIIEGIASQGPARTTRTSLKPPSARSSSWERSPSRSPRRTETHARL